MIDLLFWRSESIWKLRMLFVFIRQKIESGDRNEWRLIVVLGEKKNKKFAYFFTIKDYYFKLEKEN